MARQRSKHKPRGEPRVSKHFPGENNGAEDGAHESDGSVAKDSTEEELEKLVFGDDVGFHEGLEAQRRWSPRHLGNYSRLGDEGHTASAGKEDEHDDKDDLEGVDDANLFFIDSGPAKTNITALTVTQSSIEDTIAATESAPAWEDSDDERISLSLALNPRLRKLRLTEAEDIVNGKEYTKRLRRQFERLYPFPEWASTAEGPVKKKTRRNHEDFRSSEDEEMSSGEDMDVDEDELSAQPLMKLLRNVDGLTGKREPEATRSAKLRPEFIDIQRTKDVGKTQPSAVTSLNFHPLYPLVLSSGPASTIFLHEIQPSGSSPNPLLTSLHLRRTPLTTTAFDYPNGSRIFLSGRRRYFHVWDLRSGAVEKITRVYGHQDEQRSMERFKLSPCGRWMGLVGSSRKGGGVVNILDAGTTQWIAQARIEGRGGVADFAWWADGEGMCIASKNGEVEEWSLAERRFLGRWNDEGAVGTTVIALGGSTGREGLEGDRWVATGSASGIVNIYDRSAWSGAGGIVEHPKPRKTFEQLVTATSHLVFSPDGQLLAMGSRWKRDALRLIHLPSCTVYRNWPTSSTPLGRITAVAFSSGSNMLAVGNEQGKIRLWDIRS